MDCYEYQDALSAAALGGHDNADTKAFRLHVEVCESCRHEFARRREFLGLVDRQLETQFEYAVPSPDFNARLRRRIAAEAQPAARPFVYWWPLLAGAAAFFAAFALIHFYQPAASRSRDANPAYNASLPKSPPAETRAPEIPSKLANPVADDTSHEPPALHPVLAMRSSLPLRVRIDPRELYATVRFTQAVAEGRIDARPLVSAAQNSSDPSSGTKPLEIPPIEVRPIDDQNAELTPTQQ